MKRQELEMKFNCSIIVVEDIFRSRKLYEDILHQKVIADFGEYNVSYEGGLAFYNKNLYQNLIGADRSISSKSNNFELYFETKDLKIVENEIIKNEFEFLHPIREEPWKQLVFRFYDYDQNIVTIAETMEEATMRLFRENHTIDDIANMTGLHVDEVARQIEEYKGAES
jgi:hypothetical protein